MAENQRLSFHKRQFKAYLALRGKTKADVARKIGMEEATFRNKTNRTIVVQAQNPLIDKNQIQYFSDEECRKIVEAIHISPQWQRRIFSKVLVK